MELRVLAVGDVVGASGLKHLEKHLRSVKRLYGVDFCVVNGENASGVGLTPQQADAMLDAGADVITLGNHTWNRREICPYLDDSAYIRVVDKILKDVGDLPIFIDFHAEATSEKLAMGYYLDGKISALWGTHTHVPTADEQILPHGTGYQTDIGMTGPVVSVLGVKPEQSIALFRGELTSLSLIHI